MATALVLLMTPALALFYGGMVQKKNVLNTMLLSFMMMGVVSLIWVLVGYSFAFGKSTNGLIGGTEYLLGRNISLKTPLRYANHSCSSLHAVPDEICYHHTGTHLRCDCGACSLQGVHPLHDLLVSIGLHTNRLLGVERRWLAL